MRLGAQDAQLSANSLAQRVYGKKLISERHRHRYEFNKLYQRDLEKAGMLFSGRSSEEKLCEIIEIPEHPWFMGCQFHPEFNSTPRHGHPIFSNFIEAAKQFGS